MDYELLFKIANFSVIPAWVLLIFVPRSNFTHYLVYSHAYPYFLGLAYAYLIFSNFGVGEGGMSSLSAIRASFERDAILLAAWIHYLIFDLFVGGWIVKDAAANGIRHITITPALIFTLILGPIGLLIYLILRQFQRKM